MSDRTDGTHKLLFRAKTGGLKVYLRRLFADRALHVMILPSVILVIALQYLSIYGIIIAFKRYDIVDGFMGSPWAGQNGFEHFIDFFRSPDSALVIKNTVLIAILKLALLSFPPVILAMLLNEVRVKSAQKIFQTISYLPHFVMWVVVAGIIQTLLNVYYGPVNQFLLQGHYQNFDG